MIFTLAFFLRLSEPFFNEFYLHLVSFRFCIGIFSGETQRTLFTDTFHFPVGSHSLSEHYYLLWMDFFSRNYLSTPFYSFVEGGICAGDCGRLADVQ